MNRAELIFFAFDVYVFVSGVVVSFVDSFRDQLLYIALGSGYALVRAMGTTIESGTTGLLFSFGIGTGSDDGVDHLGIIRLVDGVLAAGGGIDLVVVGLQEKVGKFKV